MARVIFKTIVSSPHELTFIKMNLEELKEIVDFFLICESNLTHTGEFRDFAFDSLPEFSKICSQEKVRYIKMDQYNNGEFWNNSSEVLHLNEQKIRNGFVKYFPLDPEDIVISVDADEVLFANRIRSIIKRLGRSILRRQGYVLRLHQVIFRIGYYWKNCDFRGPVISRAAFYLNKDSPQWRYEGFPTLIKSGTHFSWVMTVDQMVDKIMRYSHRKENEVFADKSILKVAVAEKKYIFEPERDFHIVEIGDLHSKIYPDSLASFIHEFPEEII